MSDVQSIFGVDPEDLEWYQLSLCSGAKTNLFYDDYEDSEVVAREVDEMCLACPVLKQCLLAGIENKEWGTWGGIFLASGRPDNNRNSHKTQEVWERIRERVGNDSVL